MAARWITPKTTAVDESHKAQPLHCGLDTATRHVTTVAEAIVVAAADAVEAVASPLEADWVADLETEADATLVADRT